MKNLIIKIIMVVTSISFFIACEDNRMDGMVKDKVYLVQSGVQEVYVNYRDFADYTVTVYKSGIGEQNGKRFDRSGRRDAKSLQRGGKYIF